MDHPKRPYQEKEQTKIAKVEENSEQIEKKQDGCRKKELIKVNPMHEGDDA